MVVSVPRQISPFIGDTSVEAHTKTEDRTVKTKFPKTKEGICAWNLVNLLFKKTEFSQKEWISVILCQKVILYPRNDRVVCDHFL